MTLLIGFVCIVICLVAAAVYKYVVKAPSTFAASVARSLVENPSAWDYDICGLYLVNDGAGLEIGVGASCGLVKTTQRHNRGTATIEQFEWADMHAFRKAYGRWKSLTANARRQVAERRKREIMLRLGDQARCTHGNYRGMPVHGRCCPDCGVFMVDFGD